jgi:hypothetical protein
MHEKRTVLGWLSDPGYSDVIALSGIIAAATLLFAWIYLVRKHRRPYYSVIVSSILFAITGYLGLERDRIRLHLIMRNAEQVRMDCVQLMKRRDDLYPSAPSMALHLFKAADLPASLRRIVVKSVEVTPHSVRLNLQPNPAGFSSEWASCTCHRSNKENLPPGNPTGSDRWAFGIFMNTAWQGSSALPTTLM